MELMSASPNEISALHVEAVLSDPERNALLSAVEKLRECFKVANNRDLPIQVRFHQTLTSIGITSRSTCIVTSLSLHLIEPEESLTTVEARLRTSFSEFIRKGAEVIFLCTVFRRVDSIIKAKDPTAAAARMERIRRLNYLAVQLSHDLDINIIDFDRSFAHIGGRLLDADFRMQGSSAILTASNVIITTLFAAGLPDVLSPELQQAANAVFRQRHASVVTPKWSLPALVDGERVQNYLPLVRRRRLGDLWLNIKKGRTTTVEALLIVFRALRRRLRQKLNRKGV